MVALLATVGWLFTAHPVALAQKGGANALAQKASAVKKTLRSQTPPDKAFEAFFRDDYFALFLNPIRLTELPKVRLQLRQQFFGAGKSGPAYDRLNQLTLERMQELLKGKINGKPVAYPVGFEAAIKYNALLVIGDLNEQEGEGGKPPKPWAEALPILIETFRGPTSKDYLKVAAMIGLERFAYAGAIPQAKAADVSKAMLTLLTQKDAPAGRDQKGHDWMRRLAAQILADLGSPGPNNSVVTAFQEILNDPTASPSLRYDMAQFMGYIKFPPNAKVDATELLRSLGRETVDVCKREIEAAKALEKVPSRRTIMNALDSARIGLIGSAERKGGLAALATSDEQKKLVNQMKKTFGALYTALDVNPEDEPDDSGLASLISDKLTELDATLGPLPAAKEKPAGDGVKTADGAKPPAAAGAAKNGARAEAEGARLGAN